MITVYTCNSSSSSRKAKNWLIEHNLPFVERNTSYDPLTIEELKRILSFSENGTDDLLSKRSVAYSKHKNSIGSLSLDELLLLINQYSRLLALPIIIDDKRIQIGYNEDEIRCFLPKEVRKRELAHILLMSGI